MRTKKYHGLKKVKVRQSWSKYNLYNLSRLQTPTATEKTFFQQKWAAKSLTRAYHGEHVREGKWELMFSRDLPAVVSMNAKYLAQSDGSEWSLGRGGGLQKPLSKKKLQPETPYMHMTYGPLERRLDTAIWRALFASSARQARQFVVHGYVKVNGKKMRHPGYLLNPGDMFAVDPERVLYATGARKGQPWLEERFGKMTLQDVDEEREEEIIDDKEEEEVADDDEDGEVEGAAYESNESEISISDVQKELKTRLKSASTNIREFLEERKSRKTISAKAKQELRALLKELKLTMSKIRSASPESVKALETAADTIMDTAAAASRNSTEQLEHGVSQGPAEQIQSTTESIENNQNRDDNKPYRTPWRPRDYMCAFAFIPRYLEVNQNVCSAVYLRHPVARLGIAEVPTPVSQETSQLAFNWYLRRR